MYAGGMDGICRQNSKLNVRHSDSPPNEVLAKGLQNVPKMLASG
jgi:hypothetical protein